MLKKTILSILMIAIFSTAFTKVFAQPAWTIDLLGKEKKPEKFENRKLGSEKLAEKKFTVVRKIFQNNYTHYNYFFNANNKINAVIERAKIAQKDDYTNLLPFFPYSLENTATQKTELDSVIYKATAGILLHDLRNDWIDNMYLLMGQAYFLRKDFDSAAGTFQFINYNLFPRKKGEEDSRIVGTRDEDEYDKEGYKKSTGNHLSIANKEKRNIFQKVTARPPSRNDALLWMVRTLIEQNEMGEAAGLITTLQNDPNLPERLQDDLAEMSSFWFFKQGYYDSSAAHLEKALSAADTKQDKSRSEFLLAQLYEMTHQYDKATEYYEKSSKHTTDPLMDIYAQLNSAKMMKGNDPKELEKSIENLIKMAKKDRFEPYRDILYYSAATLGMQKPDTNLAIGLFSKSLKYNEANVSMKNKAFMQLGDIAYTRREYKTAYAMYDSLQTGDTTMKDDMERITARHAGLSKIVVQLEIIEREDSLQRVANMEPAARALFVKKLAKKLRKEKGLKEEDNSAGSEPMITFDSQKKEPVDLFGSGASAKGEWYFYNASLKSKGFGEFKRKWGTRQNADNWRRKAAVETTPSGTNTALTPTMTSMSPDDLDAVPSPDKPIDEKPGKGLKSKPGADPNATAQPEDISYEGLMSNLPLTDEKKAISLNSIANSLFELGKLYQEDLEDYQQAVETYELSLQRFPDSLYNGELYLGLYYCYTKLGNTAAAARYKNLLTTNFANSKSSQILTNPNEVNKDKKNPVATKRYEAIYDLFIEGKFDEALAQKKMADSSYGNTYWNPQLLYIEAVYHVKQRNDSNAISVLTNIRSLYPTSPLKEKATRMIEVLKTRDSLENYLRNLQVTRASDDETIVVNGENSSQPRQIRNDSNLIKSPTNFIDTSKAIVPKQDSSLVKDSIKTVTPVIKDSVQKAAPIVTNGPFVFNPAGPHNVVMVMEKVDGTYVNEAKNAFTRFVSEAVRNQPVKVDKDAIDAEHTMLIFSSFADAETALQFLAKAKRAAPDEISWLPANKYAFYIISDSNLLLLKNNKDLSGYKVLLTKQYPGRF